MIEILKKGDFDKFYKLMKKSFPSDEYRAYEEQKNLLDIPYYKAYTLYMPNNDIKAFITVWEFEDFAYIEHFAVNPKYRNKGVGSGLLGEITEKYDSLVCLEVELPETKMAGRRIGFYERNGFSLNTYPYIQPSMGEGKSTVPLLIMTTHGKIDSKTFEKIRDTLYKYVYHYEM